MDEWPISDAVYKGVFPHSFEALLTSILSHFRRNSTNVVFPISAASSRSRFGLDKSEHVVSTQQNWYGMTIHGLILMFENG